MKRILKVLLVLLIVFSFNSFLCAYSKENTIKTFSDIIRYYNNGDNKIFDNIDKTNHKLYKNIKDNMGKGNIEYNESISIIDVEEGTYKLAVMINASGRVHNSEWSVKNKYIYFTFKYNENNNDFVLIETDFFVSCGINVITKAYNDLFVKTLIIAFTIFLIIVFVTYIISKLAVKNDIKKYKESLK